METATWVIHCGGTRDPIYWVAVKELKLSYHNPKTMLFTIYAYYGNGNLIYKFLNSNPVHGVLLGIATTLPQRKGSS